MSADVLPTVWAWVELDLDGEPWRTCAMVTDGMLGWLADKGERARWRYTADERRLIERALRHCRVWARNTPADASRRARRRRWKGLTGGYHFMDMAVANWLPGHLRHATVAELRAMLGENVA